MNKEQYIDHEVRIRATERICDELIQRFTHLEDKIDSKFNFMIGIVVTSVLLPIALRLLKIV